MPDTNRYGPTAARKQGKPGREVRPKSATIDIHSHVAVPAAGAIANPHVEPARRAARPLRDRQREGAQRQAGGGPPHPASAASRTASTSACATWTTWASTCSSSCRRRRSATISVPAEIAVKATQVLNDGIAAYVARKPDRFVALGGVPLQDGKEAAKELERSMKQLGFKGCQILTNVVGKELSDPEFAPFWAKAEELGALVVIHPNGFTGGERFSRLYFNNVIGNPLDTTVALHYLIFDGVLERHPT